MRTMHLFAGAGGGLLADRILGHEPIAAVEWDKYCCEVLRTRVCEGWFTGLRVHEGDVRLFDPSEYAGRVDSIHAGFPCQDISAAGTGKGIEGERSGLWSEVVRVARDVRPKELFLENSPAITTRGLGTVLQDLAQLGYDAQWCVLSAAAVGAPHIRARWWCLARRTNSDGMRELQPKRELRDERGWACDLGKDVSSTMREGPQSSTKEKQTGANREQGWGVAGCSDWWSTEPDVGRVAHGVAARIHRIKALGNGQVPLQAAAAYRLLEARYAVA